MGMSLYTVSKIISKEDYENLVNGKYYINNYYDLKLVDKKEVDKEITQVQELLKQYISDEDFLNEQYLRSTPYIYDDYYNEETKDLFDNFKYLTEDNKYLTINEWLNYEDDIEGYIERTIDSANINGEDVYCLIESCCSW